MSNDQNGTDSHFCFCARQSLVRCRSVAATFIRPNAGFAFITHSERCSQYDRAQCPLHKSDFRKFIVEIFMELYIMIHIPRTRVKTYNL